MTDWLRDDSGLSIAQITAKQPYKLEPHAFKTAKRLPWSYCGRCGLLNLRPEYASRIKNAKRRGDS